jgi:MFS-type transporter involved in bile tolerance (Atg22 family)
VSLAVVRHFWLAVFVLVVIGFSQILFTAGCNTTLQVMVPDGVRGRMMSLYALAFAGVTPIGSFLIGTISETLGVPAACAVGGGLGLLAVLALTIRWTRLSVRRS